MDAKPFEQFFKEWAEAKWPDPHDRRKNEWILAAVRAHRRWGQGKTVTMAELEATIDEVCNIQLGGGPPPEALPE